jgi:pimeloyl-ACP methyl ester carboxylesterase
MEETRAVIDALGLERPVLWGHSDGAIIALLFGLAAPDRLAGLIAEATHYYKRKPASRAFFDGLIADPRSLSPGAQSVLERDHGVGWPALMKMHSRTWRRIADEAASATEDFYGGRLGDLAVPALIVHGARDPRTEPGELEALRAALVGAELARPVVVASRGGASSAPTTVVVVPEGGHSPHSERATADEVTRVAKEFITDLRTPERESLRSSARSSARGGGAPRA